MRCNKRSPYEVPMYKRKWNYVVVQIFIWMLWIFFPETQQQMRCFPIPNSWANPSFTDISTISKACMSWGSSKGSTITLSTGFNMLIPKVKSWGNYITLWEFVIWCVDITYLMCIKIDQINCYFTIQLSSLSSYYFLSFLPSSLWHICWNHRMISLILYKIWNIS